MRKQKCLKEHKFSYLEQICQVGKDYKLFTTCTTTSFCYFCNKVRTQRNIYLKKPNIFNKKDSEIPF